jgi:hypothetical protein
MSTISLNPKQAKVLTKLIADVPNHTVWIFTDFEKADVHFDNESYETVRKYRIWEDGRSEILPLDAADLSSAVDNFPDFGD